MWTPVVGLNAFDLRQSEIDIRPFIPLLADGKDHTFEIKVLGLVDNDLSHSHNDNGRNPQRKGELDDKLAPYWVISGTLFLFLDKNHNTPTLGDTVNVYAPAPSISMTSKQTGKGSRPDVTEDMTVSRQLIIDNYAWSANREKTHFQWKQTLSYSANIEITQGGGHRKIKTIVSASGDSINPAFQHIYKFDEDLDVSLFTNARSDSLTSNHIWDVSGPAVFPTGLQTFDGALPQQFNRPGSNKILGEALPDFNRAITTTKQSVTSLQGGPDQFGSSTDLLFEGGDWGGRPDWKMGLYEHRVVSQGTPASLKAGRNGIEVDDTTICGTKLDGGINLASGTTTRLSVPLAGGAPKNGTSSTISLDGIKKIEEQAAADLKTQFAGEYS